ncbi:MAG: hypothetical protein A2Z96_01065 [Spirochaetes bacterium GWB1_48_6]|nr:MAG: hypothetical protein A2Z96_01065 [Spirochaetes bacterium GWB1_48_6]
MKRLFFYLFLHLLTPYLFSQETEVPPDPYTTYEGLSQTLEHKPRNFYLVDCRTSTEFRAGHIPGALSVPVERMYSYPPTRDLNAIIVLYCRFGNRSDRARVILESMGYKNVHVFGKFINWKGLIVK